MPYLYVSNSTTKVQEFLWPNARAGGFEATNIDIGDTVLIGGEPLDISHINQILAGHKQYGIKAATDLLPDRLFRGLSYQVIDEPLKADDPAPLVTEEQTAEGSSPLALGAPNAQPNVAPEFAKTARKSSAA